MRCADVFSARAKSYNVSRHSGSGADPTVKPKANPTINDVARLAGVSVGTVSRVLSGNKTVRAELRDRVQSAVKELGYRPNLTARAMRTNKINILGLVVPDIGNPFFGQIARELEIEAEKRGFSILVANSHGDPERELRQIHSLVERALSGLIVVACSDRSHGELATIDTPIISLDRRLGTFPLATIDNEGMSAELGRHIADLGHRRVAYISGPLSTEVARARAEGFRSGFEAAAGQGHDLHLVEGDFSFEAGEHHAQSLLQGASRPTALIGANDQIAIGILRAARDLRLSVPEDLSVAGFDDIILAPLVVPSLTTVSQPTRELAASAVRKIVEDWPVIEDVTMPGRLVARNSTAPVRTS